MCLNVNMQIIRIDGNITYHGFQIFNEFNARKPDELNIFKGVGKNYLFLGIVTITIILQVRLVSN